MILKSKTEEAMAEMKFCDQCGNRLDIEAGFCDECGAKVVDDIKPVSAGDLQSSPAQKMMRTDEQSAVASNTIPPSPYPSAHSQADTPIPPLDNTSMHSSDNTPIPPPDNRIHVIIICLLVFFSFFGLMYALSGPSKSAPQAVPKSPNATAKSNAPKAPIVLGSSADKRGDQRVVENMPPANVKITKMNPTTPLHFSVGKTCLVKSIATIQLYIGNNPAVGTLSFEDAKGRLYGPYPATVYPGRGIPDYYYRQATPNVVIPAGTYKVINSEQATWAINEQVGTYGLGEVVVTADFTIIKGSLEDLKK